MLDMGGLSCPQTGRRVGCRSSRKDRTLAATRTASKNTSAISPQSGRISFAKIHEPLEVPNLLDLQVESFNWLVGNEIWQSRVDAALAEGRTDINTKSGLEEIFEEISPIEDYSQTMSLSFRDHRFEDPKHSVDECKDRDTTYAAPLFVTAEFMNNETEEIKSQTVFIGDFPLMTSKGTFIINGTERVVVSQLVRSPGVYFEKTADKTSDKDIFTCKVIPSRGAWLEFEIDKRDTVGVRLDRKRKQNVTVFLKALGWTADRILEEFGTHESIRQTLEKDHGVETQDQALLDIYKKLRPGEPPSRDAAQQLLENYYFNPKRYDLAKVGRYKINKKLGLSLPFDQQVLTVDDIVAAIHFVCALHEGTATLPREGQDDIVVEPDDIDHFGNRRLRTVGELIQNQLRTGLSRMERVVRDRMTTQDIEAITPQTLINIRPVTAAIKEFFGTSQLSQFMDQNNPLAEMTHKRRLSALGPGGLSRDRAGMEVRDVHPSHYGRMCPIETPEGPNIGLIGSLASFARVNAFGFIETPYRKVVDGHVTDEVVYLTADEEDRHVIAQANAKLDDDGHFANDRVLVRQRHGEADEVPSSEVDYMDVSPRQMVSVASALIPFLEHDDASRALMGANMQRQAVPLVRTEAPFVGTGMEYRCAVDVGDVTLAEKAGSVLSVSADLIDIACDDGTYQTYKLEKFRRSNAGTCINQRPLVKVGQRVEVGTPLADGPSTDNAELALGRNMLAAFMPWQGLNYEDAIILSQRIVSDDVLTSIHIEEHEVDARDTKLGAEEITRDIPNVSEDMLANLDENGIVRIGAEVGTGDILVGKVTPKGETELTPEERLLRAIFGEKAREVRDTSLKVPHGEEGTVIGVRIFDTENGDELAPGVNQMVRVYVAQKRKISIGDKLAGRHGNKGVISKILPVEDMPFLPDGTPVDIILNPLGVPSRMNVGQVLEMHLGWIAHSGWDITQAEGDWAERLREVGLIDIPEESRLATPVFDGATEQEITGLLQYGHPTRDGEMLVDTDGKATLFDGRTGEPFPSKVGVGYMYMLKLHHLVDDKIHARSTGPYSMITQQPLGGKAQFGGQRFGEMEVWAMEAYGAAWALQELLTIKSDDVPGRVKVYEAIVKGENIPEPGIPESFKVLVKEMKSLCLNVEVLNSEGQEIDLRGSEEDTRSGLGIDIGRRPGADNAMAD
ncbi:DNA-directed RNA polymerase subunit beta [Cutibacterium acnes subsp. defendens]|uniref:DNA-directed RNA polymerase subunit beta n=1 Tax=Cutibacterium acnes TaxID=1747 RepID=A0AA44U3G9_CUTAC|nr:DNA-directed RNA polymerase subunit beta [Cutibacterium acnes]EFS87921.1 DNA-directed RNA polymerase, beta subunit [Cutibacterium acnes HL001PA1]EFT09111.1 DNA-directed RNA polymerase, beta subunit [Cutibacterium acnes HL082PA2]EFT27226.1 DNA-directed RNA polymerase, beta subunit [Cutibacterium acnes HL110PA3]EFT62607.1 DNA-directed RNA polymerase, beta subunit [Cutibacterium acnes HL110PA4]EFT65793.1 DNA-directed RNA polymerase, beta subunit [Cutibacterium acnes HL060PA1]EGE68243.1 DNA-di